MLKPGMYVRIPADLGRASYSLNWVTAQIMSINNATRVVTVMIQDPFGYLKLYDILPSGLQQLPIDYLERCYLFEGARVIFEKEPYQVVFRKSFKDEFSQYYIQSEKTKEVIRVTEEKITAPFNAGMIGPIRQMRGYQFQNQNWFCARSNVSRNLRMLENSMYGLKELAGNRIFLLPHQINTIMRCLQEQPCRYMLADEVGMGKTIEAVAILTIYLLNRTDGKVLIVVPPSLKEQWRIELLTKFNISVGRSVNGNRIVLKSTEELGFFDAITPWDFLVADEVHQMIPDERMQNFFAKITQYAKNILLLSATPIEERRAEYLGLLRLLNPAKYGNMPLEEFSKVADKQDTIVNIVSMALGDLDEYESLYDECREVQEPIYENEEAQEYFEEIMEYVDEILEMINDSTVNDLKSQVDFYGEDGGLYTLKLLLAYITNTYQMDSHIIRNRRLILEGDDESEHRMPVRELIELTYDLDESPNPEESATYETLCNWIITDQTNDERVTQVYRPLLSAFFSSAQAFKSVLDEVSEVQAIDFPQRLLDNCERWCEQEMEIGEEMPDILNDPEQYEERYQSRHITVLNYLFEEICDSKVVLFTDFQQTFEYYRQMLENIYSPSEVAFFCQEMEEEEREANVYHFQNDPDCLFLLCDRSGGDGRNFQAADYVVHLDLPWNANTIEQRIGRLDRLERDPNRNVVYSIVTHSLNTFENDLFYFWNKGLSVFSQSLSGMEIVMPEVSSRIYKAFNGDFRYDLPELAEEIGQMSVSLRDRVIRSQVFDAAAYRYKPLNRRLEEVVRNFNLKEKAIFSDSMLKWARLTGLFPEFLKNGQVLFTRSKFAPQKAVRALLIPPDWSEYRTNQQMIREFKARHQAQLSIGVSPLDVKKEVQSSEIRGTFSRRRAISNEYLHFFAPGDPIFDCLIQNAQQTCNGQTTALLVAAPFNWTGFICTFIPVIDYSVLYDAGMTKAEIGMYQSCLPAESIQVLLPIDGDFFVTDEMVLQEFETMLSGDSNRRNRNDYLASSKNEGAYYLSKKAGESNYDWFLRNFPPEKWNRLLDQVEKDCTRKVGEIWKERVKNVYEALKEMERDQAAQEAADLYFDRQIDRKHLREKQKLIFQALSKPMLRMDSGAFIIFKNVTPEIESADE